MYVNSFMHINLICRVTFHLLRRTIPTLLSDGLTNFSKIKLSAGQEGKNKIVVLYTFAETIFEIDRLQNEDDDGGDHFGTGIGRPNHRGQ